MTARPASAILAAWSSTAAETPPAPGNAQAPGRTPTPAQGLELLEGLLVADRYRLEAPLGRGGHADVYRANHVVTGVPVALKLIRPTLHGDPEIVRRFDREARETHRLRHPNTVRVTDVGALPDGTRYLAMELVDGLPLSRVVADEGPFDIARAVRVARQIVKSVGEAHEAGLVHRDLKPQNVLLTHHFGDPDFVKVLDFGVCRVGGGASLTTGDALVGTPAWMAPEQWLSAETDARTDLYAVGALIVFMLTGAPPFGEPPAGGPEAMMALMRAHLEAPAPRLDALPRGTCPEALATLVARLLAKSPRDRPADARRVLATLDRLAATPDAATTTARRARWPGLKLVGLVAAAATLGLIAGRATVAEVTSAPPGPAVASSPSAPTPSEPPPSAAAAPPAPVAASPAAAVSAAPAPTAAPAPAAAGPAPAAAPAAPPAASPPPSAAPSLRVESTPPGARVVIVETQEVLATPTPTRYAPAATTRARLDRGDAVTLEFRLAGYEPRRHALTAADLDAAEPVSARLRPTRVVVEPAATPTRVLPPLRTP